MIEAIDGGVLLSCDSCSTEIECHVHVIEKVNELAQRHGWNISQDEKGKWVHTCPSCVEDQQPKPHYAQENL